MNHPQVIPFDDHPAAVLDESQACPSLAQAPVRPCVCRHGRSAHQHYRPGTECSSPHCTCGRYRRRLPALLTAACTLLAAALAQVVRNRR